MIKVCFCRVAACFAFWRPGFLCGSNCHLGYCFPSENSFKISWKEIYESQIIFVFVFSGKIFVFLKNYLPGSQEEQESSSV